MLCGIGFVLLSRIVESTPAWVVMAWLTVIGFGIGFLIQVALLAGQNAVDAADLGVATGALNFFKSAGGAAGAAIFGAILASASRGAAAGSLHGYTLVYGWAGGLAVLALILAVFMREKPLSEAVRDIADGKVDAPEY